MTQKIVTITLILALFLSSALSAFAGTKHRGSGRTDEGTEQQGSVQKLKDGVYISPENLNAPSKSGSY